MNHILEKHLAIIENSLIPNKNNKISEFKISSAIFNKVASFKLLTKCGKHLTGEDLDFLTKSKIWLEQTINNSYIFVGLDKNNKIIINKNSDCLVAKFIETFHVTRLKYLMEPEGREELYGLYPYGDIPEEKILLPHLGHLIKLEKEQFNDDSNGKVDLKTMFYLRGTMLICEKLKILDPFSLIKFQKEKPIIH